MMCFFLSCIPKCHLGENLKGRSSRRGCKEFAARRIEQKNKNHTMIVGVYQQVAEFFPTGMRNFVVAVVCIKIP